MMGFALTRFLSSQLHGVHTTDSLTLFAVRAGLAAVVLRHE
ncbi:MAG: hypothetical protein WBE20_15845 [Candidatus Acidiferrales bacterium]